METKEHVKLNVLRVCDVTRMYGQAHMGYLRDQGKSTNHLRCFYVPELVDDIEIYKQFSGLDELNDVFRNSIVILGAVERLSSFFGSKHNGSIVRETEWNFTPHWGWQQWKKGETIIILLGSKLSYWGNIAETLGNCLYEMGANEIIHCGMKVGTMVDSA